MAIDYGDTFYDDYRREALNHAVAVCGRDDRDQIISVAKTFLDFLRGDIDDDVSGLVVNYNRSATEEQKQAYRESFGAWNSVVAGAGAGQPSSEEDGDTEEDGDN